MATPVSDGTGWPGLFTLTSSPAPATCRSEAVMRPAMVLGAPRPIDAPQLLDVFRRELGLKLIKDCATINDLIVEQVEPLIEN